MSKHNFGSHRQALAASTFAAFAAFAALSSGPSLLAQQPSPVPSAPAADTAPRTQLAIAPDALEKYLLARGLKSLLIEHLSVRFDASTGSERARLGERLARLMFQQLGTTADLPERQRLEERAKQFIKAVGDAKSLGLRIELARTSYLRAEQDAEALAIAAAPEDGRAALASTLAQLHYQLIGFGQDASRTVRTLEEKLNNGQSTPADEEDVADARAMRSRAFYFAGWAGVYAAETIRAGNPGLKIPGVPSVDSLASAALECFGWHTGRSAMERASIDRLPTSTLKHEHIARAALGVAAALGVTGQVGEAVRWLDLLENDPAVVPIVRAAVAPRRISVLLTAGHYSEARRQVSILRSKPSSGPLPPASPASATGKPDDVRLSPPIARAIAAQAMRLLAADAASRAGGQSATDPAGDLAAVAEIALTDLIASRRTDDVLMLADRFGTTAIGDKGFVAVFVRGTLALEHALTDLRSSRGGKLDETPATDAAVINRLTEAARTLEAATVQPDASSFPADLARAHYGIARAQYYAGNDQDAAEKAGRAFELAGTPSAQLAQDALWLSILALERQTAETGSGALVAEKLGSAISLFVARFPGTLRSATLLVKRPDKTGLSDAKAVEILLSVEADSPLFTESRRAAARILYRQFRDNRTSDRQFAARRFLGIATEILEPDRKAAIAATGPEALRLAESTLLLLRQMLDASLALEPPDLPRSEQLLATAESLVNYNGLDRSKLGRELVFRRFQMAIARADFTAAEKLQDDIDAPGPGRDQRYVEASNRLLYLNAAARYKAELAQAFRTQKTTAGAAAPAKPAVPAAIPQRHSLSLSAANLPNVEKLTEHAVATIKFGSRLIEAIGTTSRALADPGVLSLHHDVADAAEVLFALTGDATYRTLAIRLDKAILATRPGDTVSLVRLASLAESAGDNELALNCWRDLSTAVPETNERFFIARYNTIRLTAKTDPQAATTLLRQHTLLHPSLGPPPWNQRFAELESALATPTTGTSSSPSPAPSPIPSSIPSSIPSPTPSPVPGGGSK